MMSSALIVVRAEAHIERTILHEREAAFGVIKLHGRSAEVEHDAVDRRPISSEASCSLRVMWEACTR
jgi:hypothetical protein